MRTRCSRYMLGVIGLSLLFSFYLSPFVYGEEKLIMGITTCVTGTTAETGVLIQQGVKTAIAQINDAGGINGCKVEAVIMDDQLEKVQCVNNFKKLVGLKDIFVIGTTSTGNCIATNPLAKHFKIVQMTGSSIGSFQMNDWIFRSTAPDAITVPFLLKGMKEKFGIKSIGCFYDYKDDWSVLCLPIYSKVVKELKLETPLAPQSIGRGDSDFSAQLTKMKEANLDAIFMPVQVREGALINKQARGLGIKSIFCGTSGYINANALLAAGEAGDGTVGVFTFHRDSKRAASKEFYKKFDELFPGKQVAGYDCPTWHDAFMLAAEAGRRAKIKPPITEEQRIRVRDEWAKIKDYEAATGTFSYDGPGDALPRDLLLVRFSLEKKDFILLE